MFRQPRTLLLAFSLIAFPVLPLAVFAADADQTQAQAVQTPDGKFIQNLGDHVIKIITNKQLSAEQRNAEFSKALSDSFDLKTIGRFVIGRTWNTATPAQQSEYMDLFKALLIKNYGDRMTLATGESFKVVGVRPESDKDSTVMSQITHPDASKATTIDWRVRNQDGKMSVIDVVVEGISLSVTQRQEYAAVVQNSGGQIDGLLETMRAQLKSTTVSSAK